MCRLRQKYPVTANFGLAAMRQRNDRTGVTLPDAETDYQSRLGPFATVKNRMHP